MVCPPPLVVLVAQNAAFFSHVCALQRLPLCLTDDHGDVTSRSFEVPFLLSALGRMCLTGPQHGLLDMRCASLDPEHTQLSCPFSAYGPVRLSVFCDNYTGIGRTRRKLMKLMLSQSAVMRVCYSFPHSPRAYTTYMQWHVRSLLGPTHDPSADKPCGYEPRVHPPVHPQLAMQASSFRQVIHPHETYLSAPSQASVPTSAQVKSGRAAPGILTRYCWPQGLCAEQDPALLGRGNLSDRNKQFIEEELILRRRFGVAAGMVKSPSSWGWDYLAD